MTSPAESTGSGPAPGPPTGRGLSFGSVADEYERYRTGYPDELVDVVRQYAGGPLRTALEIGAGTGKATRLFASAGVEVTALEPDPEMGQVLTRTTRGMPVSWVGATFEQLETDRRFDLVYAAAAWHWTDPATRWQRAVELLVPGGVLALFGCPTELHDPALRAAVAEVEEQVLPEDDAAPGPWSVEEVAAVDGLTDGVQRDLPRVLPTTAADFLGRLTTVSAYLALGPEARTDALARLRAVLPDRFDIDATVQLSLARRV